MLSEEEEATVTKWKDGALTGSSMSWLARKLLETNDELSQVHAELQKTNEEFSRYIEVYGP